MSDCRRALTPTGTLILNSGSGAEGINLYVRLIKPLVLERMEPTIEINALATNRRED